MKSNFSIGMLFMLSFTLMSSMCSSDDMKDPIDIMAIENTAKSGTWFISSFMDSGQNETGHFNGFSFSFENSGTLTATNGSDILLGTWSITNNNDDSDGAELNIMFSTPTLSEFEDLNDDWDITTYDNNTIRLEDVSGGNGGTDILVFTKN